MIYNEIKRNSDKRNGVYNDELANKKYAKRQKEKPKYKRFTSSIKEETEILLQENYSPEQVVGTLKKQNCLFQSKSIPVFQSKSIPL